MMADISDVQDGTNASPVKHSPGIADQGVANHSPVKPALGNSVAGVHDTTHFDGRKGKMGRPV
jgi:hypothetical protein